MARRAPGLLDRAGKRHKPRFLAAPAHHISLSIANHTGAMRCEPLHEKTVLPERPSADSDFHLALSALSGLAHAGSVSKKLGKRLIFV